MNIKNITKSNLIPAIILLSVMAGSITPVYGRTRNDYENIQGTVIYAAPDISASSAAEWQEIYKKYKNKIAGFGGLSKYEVYNASEAFAECYGHYTKDPAKVRKVAPEIADYIDRVNADVIAHFAPDYVPTRLAGLKNYKNNSTTFNAYTYYTRYTDLQQAIGADPDKLYRHYVQYGIKEGRTAI